MKREKAAAILRDAGFNPDALNTEDKKFTDSVAYRNEGALPSGFMIFDPDSFYGPALPARMMLRWSRLMNELIDDDTVDILPIGYAFDLGRWFERTDLSMNIPEIKLEFQVQRNKEVASKSRADALQTLIIDILTDDPSLRAREVLAKLHNYVRQGVIESITDDVIEWTDKQGTVKETKIKALKDRVSRSKRHQNSP
ncbi:MAG: hypothetical protein H0V34_13985 [Gammaproteobacteria bacterium]|nr:hypothetical protein [Gammaproteobacteria bacterium]